MRLSDLIRDEQDSLSAARTLLWLVVLSALSLIFLEAFGVTARVLGTSVWSLLGGLAIAFAAWAGGARIAEYLGPQIGALAQGLAKGSKSSPEPDLYRDDERGAPPS